MRIDRDISHHNLLLGIYILKYHHRLDDFRLNYFAIFYYLRRVHIVARTLVKRKHEPLFEVYDGRISFKVVGKAFCWHLALYHVIERKARAYSKRLAIRKIQSRCFVTVVKVKERIGNDRYGTDDVVIHIENIEVGRDIVVILRYGHHRRGT